MAKKRRVDNAGSCFGRPPPSAAAHRLRRGGGDCSFLRCGFLVWASAAVGGGSPPSAGGRRLFFFALRILGLGVRPQWGRLSASRIDASRLCRIAVDVNEKTPPFVYFRWTAFVVLCKSFDLTTLYGFEEVCSPSDQAGSDSCPRLRNLSFL